MPKFIGILFEQLRKLLFEGSLENLYGNQEKTLFLQMWLLNPWLNESNVVSKLSLFLSRKTFRFSVQSFLKMILKPHAVVSK